MTKCPNCGGFTGVIGSIRNPLTLKYLCGKCGLIIGELREEPKREPITIEQWDKAMREKEGGIK